MPTSYTGRTIPTSTMYTGRMKPGDFTYYTWDSATFTWDSATFTWDTAGVGSPATTYNGRIIP